MNRMVASDSRHDDCPYKKCARLGVRQTTEYSENTRLSLALDIDMVVVDWDTDRIDIQTVGSTQPL
jgi:hypothetical protein